MFQTRFAGGGRTWAVGERTNIGGYGNTGYYRVVDGINLRQSVRSKRTIFLKPTRLMKRLWR